MNFQNLLAELDGADERCAETVAASIVDRVSDWATHNGHPSLVRCETPAAQVIEVRRYLAAAIAVTTDPKSEPLLTPPEVAKQLGADPATVINWIRSGQLKASNLATGSRPRFVIQRADLDAFLRARQPDLRKRKLT